MAATNPSTTSLWKLPKVYFWSFLMILLVQGFACTVDNESTTPNASADCEPTSAQISDFVANVYDAEIVPNGCVNCHDGTGGINNGPPIFVDPADTEELQKANFCATYERAQLSSTVLIINYPQSENHGPTGAEAVYGASSLQALINFFNTVTLEE